MNFLRKNIFVKKVWRTDNPSYEMVDQTAIGGRAILKK